MAAGDFTTSTTANDIYFAAWVGDSVLDEARPYNVLGPLYNVEGRKPSPAYTFPIQDDPGASGAWAEPDDVTDADQTLTPLSTTPATATAAMEGIATVVTDVIDAISVVDAVTHFGQVLARSCMEGVEVALAAPLDFTNHTQASTTLLLDDFMAAIGQLTLRDAKGPLVAVLHPYQVSNIARDLTGTVAASFFGSPEGARVAGDAVSYKGAGFVGNIAGVEVYQTSAVAEETSRLNGGMFVKGVALGKYEVWTGRTESHRKPLSPGTILTCSENYGTATIRDAWGQAIESDEAS